MPSIKKIIAPSLLFAAAAITPAQALDLNKAFSSLTDGSMASYNEPGRYSNSARNSFVIGGVDARMPRSKVTLMSVTPPTLNAGCQGISAHFGGFSFVSGAQIEELISNIAANSSGMVISLVLKTLCPLCQGVIEAMTHMAQQAAKLSIDSCQASNVLLNSAGSLFGTDPSTEGDKAGTVCGRKVANGGQYQSYLDSMTEACNTVSDAVGELQKFVNEQPKATNPDGTEGAGGDLQVVDTGNRIWEALKVLGFKGTDDETVMKRTLMMNLLGTRVVVEKNQKGEKLEAPEVYPALLTPDQIMDLYMCGTGDSVNAMVSNDTTAAIYRTPNLVCGSKYRTDMRAGQDLALWICDEPDKCHYPKKTPVADLTGWLEGTGFVYRVARMLHTAAEDIKLNRDFSNPELLKLMESVPYPVYQVINVAAVYPVASRDLIDVTSAVIAESMAERVFEDMVRNTTRLADKSFFSPQDLYRISAAMEGFTATAARRQSLIANRIATQEMMMDNIRTLNLAIQKEVMSGEMLGSSRFAGEVTSSVAQSNR